MKKLNFNMAALLLLSCVGTTFSMQREPRKNLTKLDGVKAVYRTNILKTLQLYKKDLTNLEKKNEEAGDLYYDKHKTTVEEWRMQCASIDKHKKNILKIFECTTCLKLDEFNIETTNLGEFVESQHHEIFSSMKTKRDCLDCNFITKNHLTFIEKLESDFKNNLKPSGLDFYSKIMENYYDNHINLPKKTNKLLKKQENNKKKYLTLEQELSKLPNKYNDSKITLENYTSTVDLIILKIKKMRDKYGKLTNLDLSRFNLLYLTNPDSNDPDLDLEEFVRHSYSSFPCYSRLF